MDDFIPVSPIPGSAAFDLSLPSMVCHSPGSTELTDRSGSYLTSLMNSSPELELSQNLSLHEEQKYNSGTESMHSPVPMVNQHQNTGMMFSPSLDSMPFTLETTSYKQCGAVVSNNQDAVMSHAMSCSDEQHTKMEKLSVLEVKPADTPTSSIDEQLEQQVKWEKYIRSLQVKMAPDYNFASRSYTFEVPALDPGMKLEAVDRNNPQSFCVATVVEVVGHRVRIRYHGYGRDSSNDFWCNFQAEELYPIGWCAQNAFPLQPPTGLTCTLEEWRTFLTRTLTGALAAPKYLFPSEHYQPKVHSFEVGMKLEVIHPTKPYAFCAATVVKSLGPYYFLVSTDKLDHLPSATMCCHSDSSNIFPAGWSYKNGVEFTVPSGYTRKTFSWEKYATSHRATYAPAHIFKKFKGHKFRAGHKLEAVDLEHPHIIRVATITNVMGRVLQLFFDGQTRFQFVEYDSPDIHGFGWCERTGHPLHTPYGKMPFKTVIKREGSQSCPKQLNMISFEDVIGRKPTPRVVATTEVPISPKPSNRATPTGLGTTSSNLGPPSNLSTSSSLGTTSPSLSTSSNIGTASSSLPTSPNFGATSPNLGIPPPKQGTTHSNFGTAPNPAAPANMITANASGTTPTGQPCVSTSDHDTSVEDKTASSPVVVEENGDDKSEKCSTLSPSDDDEDISDDDSNGAGSERFYHNKNQIYFNKTCCCGPLLNPEEVKLLPDATEPGKVSTVIRIGLEMVAKCAKDPARVLDMMQDGSGPRLTIKHNGKTFKKAISRVDSRPKLERYLKRFCRRLVCCEYFFNLTPVSSPCPDDCKADQFGNLQGPKGMKAKRAREYFETKHLGYEKKKRGRKTKAAANEIAAQRAAAGIVTSVFHKGNHVPLPNLNLPVTAIADHLRNTATKILHQVQARQKISPERPIMHSKTMVPSSTVLTHTTIALSTQHPSAPQPSTQHPTTSNPSKQHPLTAISINPTHRPISPAMAPTSIPTTITSSSGVPTYGKPRLLPSPYGPTPMPITTTPGVTSSTTTEGSRRSSYKKERTANPPLKKVIRPIIPAVPVPDRNVPLVEIMIPPANKLPIPARSTSIPVPPNSTSNTPPLTSTGKPVFRLTPPNFLARSSNGGQTATSFSGRVFAMQNPNLPPALSKNSTQTTTLVTANQHPIPASISLTRAGPPPLIPARTISGTSTNPQALKPRLIAAAPNVCVTEQGTFVATQLKQTSVPSVGHSVGQSADANLMMSKMFSVVRSDGKAVTVAAASGTIVPTQIAHIRPYDKNATKSIQIANASFQSTSEPQHNTHNSFQNTMPNVSKSNQTLKNSLQNANNVNSNANWSSQNTNRSNQNTVESFPNVSKLTSKTYRPIASRDLSNKARAQKFSLNVGGAMGAVTTAVRSGMLARENSFERAEDTKHSITGYSVKIAENNLETKPSISGVYTTTTNDSANQADITPYPCDRIAVIAPNKSEITPKASDVTPMDTEGAPDESVIEATKSDADNVPLKKRSTWMYRKRKKKKVRFTYVKRNNKKKKEEEIGDEYGEFVQEYQETNGVIDEDMMKTEHDEDEKNDPPYAPPNTTEISRKYAKRASDFPTSRYSIHNAHATPSYVDSPELMTGAVLHAVQSSQHPSVKLRSPNTAGKQSLPFNGFPSPPKRSRVHSTDNSMSRKQRSSPKTGTKSSKPQISVNASTNTALPGCPGDKCLWLPDNPRSWNVEEVGEYVAATDCKNYATYFMDQEIDGESLLMLTRSTLMQFTNMKLGPTLKLSNYIAQLRARVGMSKRT